MIKLLSSAAPQMLGGFNYAYSVFAPALQQALGFSSGQMALVASALTTGGYLAIPSGATYDLLAPRHHIGPRYDPIFGSSDVV